MLTKSVGIPPTQPGQRGAAVPHAGGPGAHREVLLLRERSLPVSSGPLRAPGSCCDRPQAAEAAAGCV